jgi:FRG domain
LGRDLGSSATDLHLLAILQHHGVPTRLIDVTSNPMTALWFATEEHRPSEGGHTEQSAGVLFAIDVTYTDWYETFSHGEIGQTWAHVANPLSATYEQALKKSMEQSAMFRVFPALPDERMKAQEGFFLGSAVPTSHIAPSVVGINPIGSAPGDELLRSLMEGDGPGQSVAVSFCAIVIPAAVKDELKGPLKHTYNRRRRVLFPDVDGFREGFVGGQLD